MYLIFSDYPKEYCLNRKTINIWNVPKSILNLELDFIDSNIQI